MALKLWFSLLGACALAQPLSCWGQKSWRFYKLADGLPESGCISVTVGPQGKVIARQLSQLTLCELDGYSVTTMTGLTPSSSRVYGSPAGQLWTATAQGIEESRDGAWVLHPIKEIAAENHGGLGRLIDPVPMYPVRQGVLVFLVSDKLMRLNVDDPAHATVEVLRSASPGLGKFYSMIPSRNGGLWLGCARGIAKIPGLVRNLKADTELQEHPSPDADRFQSFQDLHEDEDGNVYVLATMTNSVQKAALLFDGQEWKPLPAPPERVRHAWPGLSESRWASTIETLYQFDNQRQEFVENEEVLARQYFDLAVEPGGVFWLATSDGLFRYSPLPWRSPSAVSRINSVIHGLTSDQEGRVWFVAGAELHRSSENEHKSYMFPPAMRRVAQSVNAIFPLRDGTFLIVAGDTQSRFNPKTEKFIPQTAEQPMKPLGLLKDRSLCVQLPGDSPDEPSKLAAYDGKNLSAVTENSPGPEIGTNLSSAWSAQNGDLWISGDRGTAVYRDKKWKLFASADKSAPESVLWSTEMPDGKIWCATSDTVWEFDGKNWSGTRRGIDRINALLRTRDGSVWVASNSGLFRFVQGAWLDNGVEEGLPSGGVRDLCEDSRGRLWAGTTRGLAMYHQEADLDPPHTVINEISDREKNLPQGETLTIGFTGADRWKYTPSDRLLFSYRLDDRDWSIFQSMNSVPFTDLAAGKHYFQVRAMDRNGNVDQKGSSLEFAVIAPWYKETRLVLISFTGMAVAIFFAGLAFNRHRQLLRSYTEVEEKVAQRTRQLDLANRELAHSQKMTALGTLAAGIAHDFNNILSIIKGSAQIIEDNVNNPDKVLTRADRIKTVVEQGSGIVKAMLGFTQDTDLAAGPCDVNEIVQQTLKLLGDRFLREVEVRFEPAADLPKVSCARDFLQQILLNFIFNAAESMTERRLIVLSTAALKDLPDHLVMPPAKSEVYVTVSVKDTGCGIPQENMSRIFEPFFTTKALSARRGTGLGLSMVYELAKKMQAGLLVTSVVNEGSTFSVILPLLDKTNAPS